MPRWLTLLLCGTLLFNRERLRRFVMKWKYGIDEWRARVQLAAVYRLAALSKWDACCVTARVPGEPNKLLVKPTGLLDEETRASSLMTVALDSTEILDAGRSGFDACNASAFATHLAIYRARPDVSCVCHHAADHVIAITATVGRFIQVSQPDGQFVATDSVVPNPFPFTSPQPDPEALTEFLGTHDVLLLANRGVLTCAPSIAENYQTSKVFDTAARQLHAALCAAGGNLSLLKAIPTSVLRAPPPPPTPPQQVLANGGGAVDDNTSSAGDATPKGKAPALPLLPPAPPSAALVAKEELIHASRRLRRDYRD